MYVWDAAGAELFKYFPALQPAEHTEKWVQQPDCGSSGGWGDVCQPSVQLHSLLSSGDAITDEAELRGGMYRGH